MIPRMTTSGSLKGYRYNLQRSTFTLNKSITTVMTGRAFNSFAEDPATAAHSFQLRRAYLRTSSQHSLNESIVRKFDVAYSSMDSVEKVIDTDPEAEGAAYYAILRALNGPDASARNALGQEITAHANDMVQFMNGRYGDNFVFAGADGLNVPLTWKPTLNPEYDETYVPADPDNLTDEDLKKMNQYLTADGKPTADDLDAGRTLYYRGVAVDSNAASDLEKLNYITKGEKKYVDIGLGYDMNGGEVESSSVYNVSLQAVDFLGGYGHETRTVTIPPKTDGTRPDAITFTFDDIPKNIVSITDQIGSILQRCSPENGDFASNEDEARFNALVEAFEESSYRVKDRYTELTTQAQFLKNNQTQLESNAYTINEQIQAIDYVNPAAAISDFIFAKYCYDTALKVGNSILSESLMDYMNFN
jgi:flagellar hook-associated protein 3 FlgL